MESAARNFFQQFLSGPKFPHFSFAGRTIYVFSFRLYLSLSLLLRLPTSIGKYSLTHLNSSMFLIHLWWSAFNPSFIFCLKQFFPGFSFAPGSQKLVPEKSCAGFSGRLRPDTRTISVTSRRCQIRQWSKKSSRTTSTTPFKRQHLV